MIYLTLRQLSDSLNTSPDNFRLEDSELGQTSATFPGPTIVWQFRVKIKEDSYILDPLNATKTIILTYNKIAKQLTCYIFSREVNSLSHAVMADTQVTFQCFSIPILNRSYRQFMRLREKLVQIRREKEYIDYMKKLNDIFPSLHEEDLFE